MERFTSFKRSLYIWEILCLYSTCTLFWHIIFSYNPWAFENGSVQLATSTKHAVCLITAFHKPLDNKTGIIAFEKKHTHNDNQSTHHIFALNQITNFRTILCIVDVAEAGYSNFYADKNTRRWD